MILIGLGTLLGGCHANDVKLFAMNQQKTGSYYDILDRGAPRDIPFEDYKKELMEIHSDKQSETYISKHHIRQMLY